MARYALLIIENGAKKSLEDGCKYLSEVLNDANTTQDSAIFHGVGTLLFDLKSSLIPFCKVTASADKLGHPVRVLFLDDKDSFLHHEVNNRISDNVIEAINNTFADIVDNN